MEQIILNIENPDIADDVMDRLKDFVKSIKGVSIENVEHLGLLEEEIENWIER